MGTLRPAVVLADWDVVYSSGFSAALPGCKLRHGGPLNDLLSSKHQILIKDDSTLKMRQVLTVPLVHELC